MTDPERTKFAEALMAVIFSMRPDDGPAGQAWVLSIATTTMARAILGSVGPAGDLQDVLDLAQAQVEKAVNDAQLAYFGKVLTQVGGKVRPQ